MRIRCIYCYVAIMLFTPKIIYSYDPMRTIGFSEPVRVRTAGPLGKSRGVFPRHTQDCPKSSDTPSRITHISSLDPTRSEYSVMMAAQYSGSASTMTQDLPRSSHAMSV